MGAFDFRPPTKITRLVVTLTLDVDHDAREKTYGMSYSMVATDVNGNRVRSAADRGRGDEVARPAEVNQGRGILNRFYNEAVRKLGADDF